MHLFFSNIYTYNGTNSNFGKLGSRVEGLFEVLCFTTPLSVLPAVLRAVFIPTCSITPFPGLTTHNMTGSGQRFLFETSWPASNLTPEMCHQERWAASGLSTGAGPRARRFTAGHAATKFEPDVVLPDRSGQLPRTASGARSGGAPAPARNGKVRQFSLVAFALRLHAAQTGVVSARLPASVTGGVFQLMTSIRRRPSMMRRR
jgi:hypothetical protein